MAVTGVVRSSCCLARSLFAFAFYFGIPSAVEAKRLEEERIANELAEKRAQEEARAARVAQLARLADVRARAHDVLCYFYISTTPLYLNSSITPRAADFWSRFARH